MWLFSVTGANEMGRVHVIVRYTGNIKEVMGREQQELLVSSDIQAAAGDLRKEIIKAAAPDLLYTLLINGSHYSYALEKGVKLKDGDELNIIPVMLGG